MRLKRTLGVVALVLTSGMLGTRMLNAQEIKENNVGMVYYMPRTTLQFAVNYTEVVEKRGIFYQYAERYLGTKDVILEESHTYAIESIDLCVTSKRDTSRAYMITEQAMLSNDIYLTDDGLLAGLNTSVVEERERCGFKVQHAEIPTLPTLLPLLEDQMLATSLSKMAEGTAKLIYQIRETRLNILAGDVDNIPQDGKSMELVLQELQAREEELTRLFVGTRVQVEHTDTVSIIPTGENEGESVLFRFSKYKGMVSKTNMSGEPIYINILGYFLLYAEEKAEKQQKKPVTYMFYYNMPGSADIRVYDKNKTYIMDNIAVAQYGLSVPVSNQILQKHYKVRFSTLTGNIESITHE